MKSCIIDCSLSAIVERMSQSHRGRCFHCHMQSNQQDFEKNVLSHSFEHSFLTTSPVTQAGPSCSLELPNDRESPH